ncbi:MAG: hypothetical protein FWD00_00630 [Clostridiales bacterium]|nr:hypothetical protein [Clostridiales bacterium]
MITQKHFQDFWKSNYGNMPPLAHILREGLFADKWFRIHSLPDSKRYADNDDEMQIILNRQNTLITDLIGDGQEYLLLLYAITENPTSTRFNQISNCIQVDNIKLEDVVPDYYEGETYFVSGFVNKVWEFGSVDIFLEKVANDERVVSINACECDLYRILIIDIKRNRIIAPYDGGVDIFLNTQCERDSFKLKYKDWLSSHEHGL